MKLISETLPPDHQQRELALDTQRSWIVEAPAGSGKTGLLIQRYLKLLVSVQQPEQVLAITFTRKATAEMRERILSALLSAHQDTPIRDSFQRTTRHLALAVLEHDRLLSWHLLTQPHRFNIRTIDAISGEIARSRPILSGASSSLSPLDNAQPLYRKAARRVLMQLGGQDAEINTALETILLHRDASLMDCENLLANMLEKRDQWASLIPISDDQLASHALDTTIRPQLEHALGNLVCATLTQLLSRFPTSLLQELITLAAELSHAEGYDNNPNPLLLCDGLRSLTDQKHDLERWQAVLCLLVTKSGTWRALYNKNHISLEANKKQKARLKDLTDALREDDHLLGLVQTVIALPPPAYSNEQWHLLKPLFRLLRQSLIELKVLFSTTGQCDFTELTLDACTVLQNDTSTEALSFGLAIQHLLVDEMQDTSSTQYDLLSLLTRGWDGYSQTVFLVGDPKQSIYLFRHARVERFLDALQTARIGEIQASVLHLSANFRSQSRLVDGFNQTFPNVFTALSGHSAEITYTSVTAQRPARTTASIQWHIESAPQLNAASQDKSEFRRLEAEEIVEAIHTWRETPLPANRAEPWRIAILVRAKEHAFQITQKLTEAGIPFRAVDLIPLNERQEILDLITLTRAIANPADRTAWLACLRAPWCGLGLADLHILADGDQSTHRHQALRPHLETRARNLVPASQQRLQRTLAALDQALSDSGRLPLSALVERTWCTLGGDLYIRDEERSNIQRYFSLLDQLDSSGEPFRASSLNDAVARLCADSHTSTGTVEIMTIHRAKGLEWDVVFLPGLERKARSNTPPLLNWIDLPIQGSTSAAHVILAPIQSKGASATRLNAFIRGMHQQREQAEVKRLFYVAATRAREELYVFATPTTKKDGSPIITPGSLLWSTWKAAQPHLRPAIAPVSNLIVFPTQPGVIQRLAATADTRPKPIMQRLPLNAPIPPPAPPIASRPAHTGFERPEGSFAARALGNTIHTFIELITSHIATNGDIASLLTALPTWRTRIAAILRTYGLSSREIETRANQTLAALTGMLSHDEGRWLLAPHPGRSTEQAISMPSQHDPAIASHLRLDCTFLAGASPLADSEDFRWIVDFKTASHGPQNITEFQRWERRKYEPQLNLYATAWQATAIEKRPIVLGLYYPFLQRLFWWPFETP